MDVMCKRSNCNGKIVDGVCDACGRPPAGASLLNAAAGNTGGAAIGSARAATSSGSTSSSSLSGRTGSSRSAKSSSRASRGSSRRALGAGLVALPPLPSLDPLLSLMADPVVPERKRFCNNCSAKLSREQGFCPNCGNEYSFRPTLKPGDLVAGQYEVKGAMAYGGLGWIYLSWDKTLSRWVVLKGLLNSKDEASAAAALAERQFLAAVKHPKIVGIYNFVNYGTEGYIVMEYVGGKTLKAIRQERGPLPVEEAIAYMHAILPAFGYLERQGMVYCDFKPDNCMLEDDDVKLIDMGGVRRVDDAEGDIYGTKGYSAPEANENPSFVSDLYTVARTLAVMCMEFKFQGANEYSLPTPQEQPIFAQHESFYRFLLKATHQDPDERFQTADEMGEQLLGVLREIVAVGAGTTKPAESVLFFGDAMGSLSEEDALRPNYRLLPALKVDALDPAANLILSAGAITGKARQTLFERAVKQFPESQEAPLRLADALIEDAVFDTAEKLLAQAEAADAFDWRVHWLRGRLLLARDKFRDATAAFDRVYSELPGELAPKLAAAIAAELAGDLKTAIRLYDRVSRTDPNFTSAAFGLARCLATSGDRDGAIAAYSRVPATSSFYTQAQMALARTCLQNHPAAPGENELMQASKAIQALTIEGLALHRLSAELLLTAVDRIEARAFTPNGSSQILGQTMQSVALRTGAERELRACAHFAQTYEEKVALVDRANEVRPKTLT